MNTMSRNNTLDLEHYRLTAQAIGLIELLGNMRPDNKQVRMAERLVQALGLLWEACENQRVLLRALKYGRSALNNH